MEAERWQGVEFATIYIGGGTPSLLGPAALGKLLDELARIFLIRRGAEVTVEVNPGTVDGQQLKDLRAAGFTRVSIGVQSLDDEDLRFLGRAHTVRDAVECVQAAQEAGFECVSIDLIRGLPGHERRFGGILRGAIALEPDHMSCYGLEVHEGTRLADDVACGRVVLPSEDDLVRLWELTDAVLSQAGYWRYEVSNWARSAPCLHNVNYWMDGDYLGLGPAAWSHRRGERWGNVDDWPRYRVALAAGGLPPRQVDRPDRGARAAQAALLALRTRWGITRRRLAAYGPTAAGACWRQLQRLAELGLVEVSGERAVATPRGLLLLNEIGVRLLEACAEAVR